MHDNIPEFTAEEAIVALRQSWEVHTQAFGPILEPAFVDDVPTRVTLIAALNLISRREVKPGLEKLQSIKEKCQNRADWAAWWFFVGLCFEMAGIKEQMLKCYENAGEYGHRFYLPYLKMAKAAHSGGDFEKAETYYLKGIDCLKDTGEAMILGSAYANYGSCLVSMGRFREAEAALMESRKAVPELPGRTATEAILYAFLGDKEKTEKCLALIAKKEPKIYESTRQTIAGILKEETKMSVWNIQDKTEFVIAMDEIVSEKCGYGENMSRLSPQERVFFVTQGVEKEINNGGFDQLFYNSMGNFANEMVAAFRAIGANATADICQKALDIFGQDVPTDWSTRQELLMTITDDGDEMIFEECDDAFYTYTDDLETLNYEYIMKNKDHFRQE